jgi:hypothetical protein
MKLIANMFCRKRLKTQIRAKRWFSRKIKSLKMLAKR